MGIATRLYVTLYNITRWLYMHLWSRACQCRKCNYSLYYTHLAALLWTAFPVCISVAVWGYQIVEAYSDCGLTNVLYTTDFRSFLWTQIFHFWKPRVWFALLVMLSVLVLHDRSSKMVTCRYFADKTLSISIS